MEKLIGIIGLGFGAFFLLFNDEKNKSSDPVANTDIPRGIRNNNPGNIKKTSDKWDGLSANQNDKIFFQFIEPEYGIRALTKILDRYYTEYGLKTISEIIQRYAPGSENDTGKYIMFVSSFMMIEQNEMLDFPVDMYKLAESIINYENGQQPYSHNTLMRGFNLGGYYI